MSFEDAANLLTSYGFVAGRVWTSLLTSSFFRRSHQRNGTFIITMGPAPSYATVSVMLDKCVRQTAIR